MKNLLLISCSILITCSCGTKRNALTSKFSVDYLEKYKVGDTSLDDVADSLGAPNTRTTSDGLEKIEYYRHGTEFVKVVFYFDTVTKKLHRILWKPEYEEADGVLLKYRNRFHHANFQKINPPQCNPHAIDTSVFYIDTKLGLTIFGNEYRNSIEYITWGVPSSRTLASIQQPCPDIAVELDGTATRVSRYIGVGHPALTMGSQTIRH